MEGFISLFSSSPQGRETAGVRTLSSSWSLNVVAGLLLGSVFLGLATYILAFVLQRSKLKAFNEAIRLTLSCQGSCLSPVKKMYGNLLVLIFLDFANAVSAIILVFEIFRSSCDSELTCSYIILAWFLLRNFGFVLHLKNALMCLRYLCQPEKGVRMWPVYILGIVTIFVFIPLFLLFSFGGVIIFLEIDTIVLSLVFIAKCTQLATSPFAAAQKIPIVLVTMFTILGIFAPTFILRCMASVGDTTHLLMFEKALFGTNFQLLMDGLLCYFVLRLPSEDEQQQQQQQQNQTAVFENQNYNMSSNVNMQMFNDLWHPENRRDFASQQIQTDDNMVKGSDA